jgi:hypothetical protein
MRTDYRFIVLHSQAKEAVTLQKQFDQITKALYVSQ